MNLKRVLSGKKDVFGLDIGSSSVKAIQLYRENDGYRIVAAGCVKIEHEGSDDRIKDNNLVKAVRKCVKGARLKTKYAVCGVCGQEVAARRFKFPILQKDEIANSVLFEAEQVCPFESGRYVVDYQVTDTVTNQNEKNHQTIGVLTAATPYAIGFKTQLARSGSLKCVLMDVDGLALLNCLAACEKPKKGQTTAILDIGSMYTNLAVLSSDGTPFVRDIPHGGDSMIEHIKNRFNLSSEVVQDILWNSGQKTKESRDLIEGASSTLIADISRTLNYIEIQEAEKVDKILICGGLAYANGFVELLKNKLKQEIALWNPLTNMRYGSGVPGIDIIKNQGSSLALAAGLAMRTI